MDTTNLCHTIVEHQHSAILLLNTSLAITYANPASEQLLGLSIRQLQGAKLLQLLQFSSIKQAKLQESLQTGQGFTDVEVSLVLDGHELVVDLACTPIFDANEYLLLELKPVSQQKRLTQELYQHNQQLAAKELVRGLAHEIKNPLGGLRGAAQLLEKELPSLELKEYTQIIIEQADRLRNLVDRLLGPQRPGVHSVHNLHIVLEKVRQLVCLNLPDNICLVRDYDPSIPDIEMDPEQLQQAFLNILQNAVQALVNGGEVQLITRTVHHVVIHGIHHKLAAEIKVIDNGPGIPEALRDTLFYPMVTGKADGTGLGLSIAQNLIDQHKGRIECASWPGRTEFTLVIPISKDKL